MTVLLLGASGFLGSWALRRLASRHPVTVLLRPTSDPWRIAGVDGVELRTAPETDWADVVRDVAPDVLLSLDWNGVAGAHRDDPAQWANLERHRILLEAAAAAGTRRYVGVGSQAEYGPHDEPILETMPVAPVTEYGRAKLAAAEASRELCASAGMEWVWARVFSTYGPLDHGHWLLPQIADALLAGRDIDLSPGTQLWSYLYGADAGEALSVLAVAPDAEGIVNVGDPTAPQLRWTIEEFARHLPRGGTLRFGAIPFGPTSVRRLVPDVGKLEALGWRPRTGLTEGLELTARWLRGDPVDDPARPGIPLTGPR